MTVSHLDQFVPSAGDDDGVTAVWGETDTGHPLGVTFVLRKQHERIRHKHADEVRIYQSTNLYLNRVFAHAQRVPQFDGFIPRARHDLTVIGREGHAQHIFGVSHKMTGCSSTTKKVDEQ